MLAITLLTTAAVGSAAVAASDGAATGQSDLPACANSYAPSTGQVPLSYLLVSFEDERPATDRATMASLLFGEDPAAATGPGSMREYLAAASHGRLEVTAGPEGVVGWLDLEMTRDEAATNPQLVVERAVRAADRAGYDFGAYDADGDGCAHVNVIFQGTSRGDLRGSHSWLHFGEASSGEPVAVDGVTVDGYTLQPARPDPESSPTVGVWAHEVGHLVSDRGLVGADLYTRSGIDRWGLMGLGYRGTAEQTGDSPLHPTAWTKTELGWANATRIPSRGQPGILPPTALAGEAYRIDADGTDDRYYLLENRQPVGFDAGLRDVGGAARDPGLRIWRVDETAIGGDVLAGSTHPGTGATVAASSPDVPGDGPFVLENVTAAYGTIQFGDPPRRTLDGTAAYAVAVNATLPNGTRTADRGPVDARASWRRSDAGLALELYRPDGTLAAASRPSNRTSNATRSGFAVVRGGPDPTAGGWKLVERARSGSVAAVAARTHPTFPLPTRVALSPIDDLAGPAGEAGLVTIDVEVFAGSEPYAPGPFGPLNASNFAVAVGGEPLSAGAIDVARRGSGTYRLRVQTPPAAAGLHDLRVAVSDEKLGVAHATTEARTAIEVAPPSTPVGTTVAGTERPSAGTTVAGTERPSAGTTTSDAATATPDPSTVGTPPYDVAPAPAVVSGSSYPDPGPDAAIDGPARATAGERVVFSGANSTAVGSGDLEYRWTIGDGSTFTGPTVAHAFDTRGTRVVNLTVVGPSGHRDHASATVTVTAADDVVIDDYDGSPPWPGRNDLGRTSAAGGFENGGGDGRIVGDALKLSYDGEGLLVEGVGRNVSGRDTLAIRLRGAEGGEGEEVAVSFGDRGAPLASLTDDRVGTNYSTVRVDLAAWGVDRERPGQLRLNFWGGRDAAGTVYVDEVRLE